MRLHIHFPHRAHWRGANLYQQCRCGARKVVRNPRGYSAVTPGWPKPGDGWETTPVATSDPTTDERADEAFERDVLASEAAEDEAE